MCNLEQSQPTFKPRCLSIDLEVRAKDNRIREFAAVRGDDGASMLGKQQSLKEDLTRLDEFAEGLSFLLGHNLIAFDLPHLQAAQSELAILALPAVDTLWLNPLAFPRHPYHRLVKHYQDGRLHRGTLNDPELDARLALDVFRDQREALGKLAHESPELLLAWHWLTTSDNTVSGLNSFFTTIRQAPRPTAAAGISAVESFLMRYCCQTAVADATAAIESHAWPLAYAMAWLSVAGGNSVMPPWVRHQFPQAAQWIRKLRNTPCQQSACAWCRENHDARKALQRWFGFSDFRSEPADEQGRSLQLLIVEAAMRGEHLLGVLPTGTGKSLCYQLPALSRYDKTGALTLVVSPLVALMADQVTGLEARGITACAALNGLLSLPERTDVLDRVRLGDIGILIVSPEQLRSPALRRVLAQREIGGWVLDEAHCISKWGHDFRPDYRYVGRFIRDWSETGQVAPVLCLTATAKPDVVADIREHFQGKVGVDLAVYDGGADRHNLAFDVIPTTRVTKFEDIFHLLQTGLPEAQTGGAIVYCAARRQTEEVADFLREKGVVADRFHAGLPPESKKTIQAAFIEGELRVIVATNAFGMGIDKPDVRLVIHADIPGSLENYLQEAGRAGRDREAARCVLLYSTEDVERQFSLSAYSRLSHKDIKAIHKSLRRLDRKKRQDEEIVATAGEILAEEEGVFERDSTTDDTRVRTALLWLEESRLLTREENRVQVFPSSLRVSTSAEAEVQLAKGNIALAYQRQLLNLVECLIAAEADEGVSTDELVGATGLSADGVRRALYDLEHLGIASNDTALTAYVHHGVARSSKNRFEQAAGLELELIGLMREQASDLGKGESSVFHLRQATQQLKDLGYQDALPEKVWRLLRSLSMDGRTDAGGVGSIRLKKLTPETVQITLQRDWRDLDKTAQLRRAGAAALLEQLLGTLPKGARGNDLLAETTLGRLRGAIDEDIALGSTQLRDPVKLIDYALLWLHEQEVIRLNKGMAVFRPAMTIKLTEAKRGFLKADFIPLEDHYQAQILQIHVMAEYAQRALKEMADALRLAMSYFSMPQEAFVKQWLPGRGKDLQMQTTPESWRRIVETLDNPSQQQIVTDTREQTNVLVLAGPGSGKTRVLVHRIAYLIRVQRENARGILALAYNRHAAAQIRSRLVELIGDDARGVTILTCHALAMRLLGVSLVGRDINIDTFNDILCQATDLLNGDGLAADEADAQRERLLAGFRWILVDEYQDVGPAQYQLIAALAGRTLSDPDGRLSLFAVGDDDQNIYAFAGASIEYIRRFEQDYAAKSSFLIENYRSTEHIVNAANLVIERAGDRMKTGHPSTVNRARLDAPAGGDWMGLDPVTRGCVQILHSAKCPKSQAVVAMQELLRKASLDADWDWSTVAVIAREWRFLEPVRSYCEREDIAVQMADEQPPSLWNVRETRLLTGWLESRESQLTNTTEIRHWLRAQGAGIWWEHLEEVVDALGIEVGESEIPVAYFIEWLVDWGREFRRKQTGLLLLTAHRSKGLEFDHVVVLDGGWERTGRDEDLDAPRRLYYVAMSRAKQSLSLLRFQKTHLILDNVDAEAEHFIESTRCELPDADLAGIDKRYYRLTLNDVYIGYTGCFPSSYAIHADIAAVNAGDALQLRVNGSHRDLLDVHGRTVGRLAKSFVLPEGMTLLSASVTAVTEWSRRDSAPEYQHAAKCDQWEVVIPELIFGS